MKPFINFRYWLAVALYAATLSVAAPVLAMSILPSGDVQTVFSWANDKCSPEQIPDSGVRAFRSADGKVRLMAAHHTNQFLVGDSLDSVRPACSSTFTAAMNADPELFNAKTWLQTFYSEDGQTIYSLGSADYHGTWFARCTGKNKDNPKCWRSAIVLARSLDGGKTFSTSPPPDHIIAAPPVRFVADEPGRPAGFFTTSNIVKQPDGQYYTLVYTFGFDGQKAGNCLMRTSDLSNARSWRAWNGKAFDGELPRPPNGLESKHPLTSCMPVGGLPAPVRSLLWHELSGQYVAVYSVPRKFMRGAAPVVEIEFRFTTSSDLIKWSPSKVIMTEDYETHCTDKSIPRVAYPSMIDPSSKDRNFGTVGNKAYIYFTRYNTSNQCKITLDRDLVRVPITIEL
jgi:hypothetical protein